MHADACRSWVKSHLGRVNEQGLHQPCASGRHEVLLRVVRGDHAAIHDAPCQLVQLCGRDGFSFVSR